MLSWKRALKSAFSLPFILRASVAITAASNSSLLPTGCPTMGVLPLGSLSPHSQGQRRCLYSRRWLVSLLMPIHVGLGRGPRRASLGHATTCKPLAYTSGGLCPCRALKPHSDDTWCFSAPFVLKPLTEQFPYSSAGSVVAELKGTSVVRVALISAVSSIG